MKKNIYKVVAMLLLVLGMILFTQGENVKAAETEAYVLSVDDQEDIASKLQTAIKHRNNSKNCGKTEWFCSNIVCCKFIFCIKYYDQRWNMGWCEQFDTHYEILW